LKNKLEKFLLKKYCPDLSRKLTVVVGNLDPTKDHASTKVLLFLFKTIKNLDSLEERLSLLDVIEEAEIFKLYKTKILEEYYFRLSKVCIVVKSKIKKIVEDQGCVLGNNNNKTRFFKRLNEQIRLILKKATERSIANERTEILPFDL